MRKKSNEKDLTCRFNFPFEKSSETKLEFQEILNKDGSVRYRAKIITKRNDVHLNTHQRLQLQGWRANCDIQIVIDYEACIEYLTKYASKSEPKSPALKQSLKDILKNVSSDCQSDTIIRKLMMKALGERDISAQETMHHLLSLKLYS